MVQLTQNITIRRDPATIFAWLTDLSRGGSQVFDFGLETEQIAWQEGAGLTRRSSKSRNTITASGPLALGTTVTSHVESFPPDMSLAVVARVTAQTGETSMEITAFDPPHRLGYRMLHGPFPGEASLILTPVANGTHVTYALTLHAHLRTTLFLSVLRAPMRRKIRQKLHDIAEGVEADTLFEVNEQDE